MPKEYPMNEVISDGKVILTYALNRKVGFFDPSPFLLIQNYNVMLLSIRPWTSQLGVKGISCLTRIANE